MYSRNDVIYLVQCLFIAYYHSLFLTILTYVIIMIKTCKTYKIVCLSKNSEKSFYKALGNVPWQCCLKNIAFVEFLEIKENLVNQTHISMSTWYTNKLVNPCWDLGHFLCRHEVDILSHFE